MVYRYLRRTMPRAGIISLIELCIDGAVTAQDFSTNATEHRNGGEKYPLLSRQGHSRIEKILVGITVFLTISGATHPQTCGGTVECLQGPVTIAGKTTATANLSGTARASGVTVNALATGAGINGPRNAQVGLAINITKQNWTNSSGQLPAVGEIDGIYVTGRQAGVGSDHSGILVDVGNTGQGFLSATEMVSHVFDPTTWQVRYGLDVQQGVLNMLTGDRDGAVYTATTGALGNAILMQNNSGASWANFIYASSNGTEKFRVDANGKIWADATPGVSCHGSPTANYAVTNGIVTRC